MVRPPSSPSRSSSGDGCTTIHHPYQQQQQQQVSSSSSAMRATTTTTQPRPPPLLVSFRALNQSTANIQHVKVQFVQQIEWITGRTYDENGGDRRRHLGRTERLSTTLAEIKIPASHFSELDKVHRHQVRRSNRYRKKKMNNRPLRRPQPQQPQSHPQYQ